MVRNFGLALAWMAAACIGATLVAQEPSTPTLRQKIRARLPKAAESVKQHAGVEDPENGPTNPLQKPMDRLREYVRPQGQSPRTNTPSTPDDFGAQEPFHYSSDGKYLVAAMRDGGGLALWETTTGRRICRLANSERAYTSVAIADNAQWIAAVRENEPDRIDLWRADGGRHVRAIRAVGGEKSEIAFADGNTLVVVAANGETRAFSVPEGAPLDRPAPGARGTGPRRSFRYETQAEPEAAPAAPSTTRSMRPPVAEEPAPQNAPPLEPRIPTRAPFGAAPAPRFRAGAPRRSIAPPPPPAAAGPSFEPAEPETEGPSRRAAEPAAPAPRLAAPGASSPSALDETFDGPAPEVGEPSSAAPEDGEGAAAGEPASADPYNPSGGSAPNYEESTSDSPDEPASAAPYEPSAPYGVLAPADQPAGEAPEEPASAMPDRAAPSAPFEPSVGTAPRFEAAAPEGDDRSTGTGPSETVEIAPEEPTTAAAPPVDEPTSAPPSEDQPASAGPSAEAPPEPEAPDTTEATREYRFEMNEPPPEAAEPAAPAAKPAAEAPPVTNVKIHYATNRNRLESKDRAWPMYFVGFFASLPAVVVYVLLILAVVMLPWIGKRSWAPNAVLVGVIALVSMASIEAYVRSQLRDELSGELYGCRPTDLSYGVCDISVPPPKNRQPGDLSRPISVWVFQAPENEEKHFMLRGVEEHADKDAFYRSLSQQLAQSDSGAALLFVHGYNVSFEDAIFRTAQLAVDLKFPGAAMAFCWPSYADPIKYTFDEQNAEVSISALQEVLSDLATRSGAKRVHMIAHSMGNRVMAGALRSMDPTTFARNKGVFRELVLAAPDIDSRVFRSQVLPHIINNTQHCTLYASSRDRALLMSRCFHNYQRLGETQPELVVAGGLDTIDASMVDTSLLGHSYIGDVQSIVSDLHDLVVGGKRPTERLGLQVLTRNALMYWTIKPELRSATDTSVRR